jgi:hypothetical protein
MSTGEVAINYLNATIYVLGGSASARIDVNR